MSGPSPPAPAHGRQVPVLLLAPSGRDARLLHGALVKYADGVRVLEDPRNLATLLQRHAIGVLVMTQEALSESAVRQLEQHARAQAPWEELQVLLLVDPAAHTVTALADFQRALPQARILVLQRPARPAELGGAVETVCRSRWRQYAVRDHIERQDLLRRELNHRVRNILATVQALHGLSAASASDMDDLVDRFEGRLEAMAGVHRILHAVDYEASDLRAVAETVLAPYGAAGTLTLDGAPLSLEADAAQMLALVLHELATDASKYGALSLVTGRVRLSWSHVRDTLQLVWSERGGPPATRSGHSGYGTRFMETTMQSYGGTATFDYAADGLSVTLAAPAARLLVAPP